MQQSQHPAHYGVSPPAHQNQLISTDEFARLHLEHITAHPPDSVLFPFLHGLEGENTAQCMFFASSGTSDNPPPNAGMIRDNQGRVLRPPQYRGLVWVLADEDIQRPSSPWDDDEYDSDSEDFSDEDHDIEMGSPESDIDPDSSQSQHAHHHNRSQDSYMHPLTLRISTADSSTNTKMSVPFPSAPLNIAYLNASPPQHLPHDRRDSSASSTESSSSSTDADASSFNSDSLSVSTTATSLPSPTCAVPMSFDTTPSHLDQSTTSQNSSASPHKHPRSTYPILTCSFLPSQLIQPCPPSPRIYDFNSWKRGEPSFEIDWEFKPTKVPDGISLRNFGIQVSIYSSISDIVVYSPKGPTPVTFRIAERFRKAITRKRRERLERWRQAGLGSDQGTTDDEGEDPHSTPHGFLKYGVYVLDANADQFERDLPWLVVRKDGDCNGDCERVTAPARPTQATCCQFGDGFTHGLTEATDGRLVGELEIEAKLAAEQEVQSALREQDSISLQVAQSSVHLNDNARLHRCRRANTIDFAQREKDEMRDLTRASEILTVWDGDLERDTQADHVSGGTTATYWNPNVGQVFLGNASDVPLWRPSLKRQSRVRPPSDLSAPCPPSIPPSSSYQDHPSDFEPETPSPFNPSTNDPTRGLGFDICVECHEHAPLPLAAHLRAAEEHIRMMEIDWVEGWRRHWGQSASDPLTASPPDTNVSSSALPPVGTIPPRPPPHPSAIVHLPFPSSPQATSTGLNALLPVIKFLERMVTPGGLGSLTTVGSGEVVFSSSSGTPASKTPSKNLKAPSWSCIPESPNSRSGSNTPSMSTAFGKANNGYLIDISKTNMPEDLSERSSYRPRPLKVLLYSSDGYTESSVPALCLLMAVKGLSLPEAYLEMQVTNRRSFFVYQSEVGLLRKVEARLPVGARKGPVCPRYHYGDIPRSLNVPVHAADYPLVTPPQTPRACNRPHALTINHGRMYIPTRDPQRRARASTLPSFIPDHQCWFDDARFDGSFPSRVLPFLYLGNLNHAANAYMLHALGITHVVSVGECALVPPPQKCETAGPIPQASSLPDTLTSTTHVVPSQSPNNRGSLWIEEREGRIKVLDIKGVCDDGIDTLEPQLHPICTWIERARLSGGRVLVHCRVGVSRSATVTIAYVMQHLGLSLVEAYLVVRSRRLLVLIQPNMRLLYNLLGWEVRLARERAGGDERKLKEELGRALSWPYLAREVHALNEKYLS